MTDTTLYSGDWAEHGPRACTCHRYADGFTGRPADTWNGWAVFTVTRPIMTAIIDTHHHDMAALITDAVSNGQRLDQAWLTVQDDLPSLSWLGELVIVDSRRRQHDPHAVEVIAADPGGRYRVGFGWSWDRVDSADCHTVHGLNPPDPSGWWQTRTQP